MAGRLNVFVRGEADGVGVYGATVTVVCGDTVLSSETDAEGLATIDDPGLEGTADVHVRIAGYALESMYGVAAANVTIPVIANVEAAADQIRRRAGRCSATMASTSMRKCATSRNQKVSLVVIASITAPAG